MSSPKPAAKMPENCPPRPSEFSVEVDAEVVRQLLPKAMEWLRNQDDDPDEDEVRENLMKAVNYETDGYAICKSLEDEGWYPNSELVSEMESAWSFRNQAINQLLEAWVKQHGLEGPAIGSRVVSSRDRQHHGEVVRNHEGGFSTVFCEHLGHVREGARVSGTMGVLLKWEDLLEAEEPVSGGVS